jgi:GNAT superfamily N-acetyltransferase
MLDLMGQSLTIDIVDARTLTDDEIIEISALGQILSQEAHPEDPVVPHEQLIAQVRTMPDFFDVAVARARRAGTLIGTAVCFISRTGENEHLLNVDVAVTPDARRQGVGRALATAVCDVADREIRTLVVAGTSERVPSGESFAVALGASAGLQQHLNRLEIANVDRAQLERWVAQGPVRAAGYEVLAIDGPIPDDLIDAVADLYFVMNDAPRDDIAAEDERTTPAQLRAGEASAAATGRERWMLLARHAASGDLAGLHTVGWNPTQPATVWVGVTGVRPEHRGHALGTWLKAQMTLRIIDQRPGVNDIRTGNADSNDAMLGINRGMGYQPYVAGTVWQIEVEALRKALAAGG